MTECVRHIGSASVAGGSISAILFILFQLFPRQIIGLFGEYPRNIISLESAISEYSYSLPG